MSDRMIDRNRAFYEAFGFPYPMEPTAIEPARRNQLMVYILSEVVEFGHESELLGQVAELTDVLYFVLDAFLELGIDPSAVHRIVHDSNMAKLWPDGKPRFDESRVPPRMLRPSTWEPPIKNLKRYLDNL